MRCAFLLKSCMLDPDCLPCSADVAGQCAVQKAYRARAYALLLQPTLPYPEMPLREYQVHQFSLYPCLEFKMIATRQTETG